MLLTFLQAADGTRLTKTITRNLDTGELVISAYPMVGRFTSTTLDCQDLSSAFDALRSHAEMGACLLKGTPTSQITNESRAGKTIATDYTEYLVLDLDFAAGFLDIDDFLAQLDPALADVSYIFQHSTSAGVKGAAGLRGHVFIRLAASVPAPVLKQWLMERNLSVPALRQQITLTASHQALRWPLDITTCQNDKLIYVAPPICVDIVDPIAERFVLRTKTNETAKLDFTVNPAVVRDQTDNLVTELRNAAGLRQRKARYRVVGGEEILLNPDQAVVTGIRQQRGFVYLNLNNGDSWAYYFPEGKPELLYNFKGEPIVRLKDIAPEFYRQLTTKPEDDITPLIFRDWATDTYYNGLWNDGTQELILNIASSKEKLRDFAANWNTELPEPIPDWSYIFDPTTYKVVDIEHRWANRFVASPYIRDTETQCITMPGIIGRVIRSVCGDDNETTEYFLNWLAYIFQTRKKTKTAWIFHGTYGTGKGVLLSRILAPLFGPRYVQEYTTANLDDNFNGALEECIIQFIDEFHVEDARGEGRLINKIKNLITEDTVMIRAMRRNPVQRRLYNNIIIATNHQDPYPLDDRDRRFNVAPAQQSPLEIEQQELDAIPNELKYFAAYLRDYTVDERKAQRILINDARRVMIGAAENSVDRFFRSIHTGDIDFFLQFLRDKPPITPDNNYIDYERAVRFWAANLNRTLATTRDELMAAYTYLQNTRVSPNKFTSMCKRHALDIKPHRINGEIKRGVVVTWQTKHPDLIQDLFRQPNVVSLPNAS